jgi:hypothetical protein
VSKRLKIASWNINSVRARIGLVERLLADEQPDVLCLQETKADNGAFPAADFRRFGYVHQQLNGQKMHHGVAILSKVELCDAGSHDWQDNGEARHVGVRLPCGIRVENVYVPAGGDIPDRTINPKFGQKSSWDLNKTPLGILLSPNPDIGRIAKVIPSKDPRVLIVQARDARRPEFGTLLLAFVRSPGAPGGLRLEGWTALDAQNKKTTVKLDNQRYNVAVPDSAFRFAEPKKRR